MTGTRFGSWRVLFWAGVVATAVSLVAGFSSYRLLQDRLSGLPRTAVPGQ